MKRIWDLRNEFHLIDRIAITRKDFEAAFRKTNERITFTFNGWDGKSYNGESRNAYVLRCDLPGYEEARFIKVGKGIHYILEDSSILETATGEYHKEASWFLDVIKI
ncbi:MAG: hypothetical protein PHV18_00110 [Lachnospiraceae bacterium]|nr:hypothetical protein [Lachnospiraceae bacterium]